MNVNTWFFLMAVAAPLVFAKRDRVNKEVALGAIRKYCKACHAVDELRFIRSEDNEELWKTIWTEKSPKSGKIWAERIIAVLEWPNGATPPFDQPISADADWMPKGYKRLLLAEDQTEGIPTRKMIVDTLKKGQIR